MIYTKEQFAAHIDGREYPFSLTREEKAAAKEAGLVVCYGASDDLAEFEGAINYEVGASDRPILISGSGPIIPPDDDEREVLEKFKVLKYVTQEAANITPVWGNGGISWQYKTEIPHATFEIKEDDETYCIGIVFDFDQLP